MIIERKQSKFEDALEYILEPKHLRILLFFLFAINGILVLFIVIMSLNNPILLHDFLVDHNLVSYGIPRIDQVNATNITYLNYTQ